MTMQQGISQPNPINYFFYLKKPATIRKVMKRVKPDQTPESPKIDGAYKRKAEDIAPTVICNKNKILKDDILL